MVNKLENGIRLYLLRSTEEEKIRWKSMSIVGKRIIGQSKHNEIRVRICVFKARILRCNCVPSLTSQFLWAFFSLLGVIQSSSVHTATKTNIFRANNMSDTIFCRIVDVDVGITWNIVPYKWYSYFYGLFCKETYKYF